MNRIAVSVLALAISVAAGSALAAPQDYGSRYDNNNSIQRPDNGDYGQGRYGHARTDWAQVIRVENRFQQGYEREECWNEQTRTYDNGYYRDNGGRIYRGDSTANGTLLGAVIGGALGNQVGKGDGKKAATVAGAVIGGVVGNNVDRNHDSGYNNGYSDDGYAYDHYQDNSGTIRRCRIVSSAGGYGYDSRNGRYEVTYRYAGQIYHAVTNTRPGRSIRVAVDVRPLDSVRDNRRY